MDNKRIELLKDYIKYGKAPILVENIPSSVFDMAIVLDATCPMEDLNGHYEGVNFLPPKWYEDLMIKSKQGRPVLLIQQINKIEAQQQKKFIEILKYKKISTFDLPEDCLIVVTANNIEESKIDEEVYSLLAHI